MQLRHKFALAQAILWISLSPLTSWGSLAQAQVAQAVDQLLADWNQPGSPGAAVAITHNGHVVYRQGYGLANLEHGIPIAFDTPFELASVSKQFTALAVFLLESEGRLSLDDPLQKSMPEVPDYGSAIKIRHLIYHTSGLPEYLTMARFAGFEGSDVIAFDDLIAMLQHWEGLYFTPGSRWRYSNTNYALLAEIVARVTGETFPEWMEENVFGPLQMHGTFIQSSALQVIPGRADGYRQQEGEFVIGREMLGDFPGPAHAYSTIDDMVKWLENFRSMTVGGADVMQRMVQSGTGSQRGYAGGLYTLEYRGITTLSHSGVGGGFRTNVTYSPDADVGVVVLANVGSIEPNGLALRILDVYLGSQLEPIPEATASDEPPYIELEPSSYEVYAGRYVIEGAGIGAALWREGDQLMGAMEGLGVGRLYAISETEFRSDDDSVRITFFPGEEGRARRAQIVVGDQHLWATRVETTAGAADEKEYAGLYYSDELGTVYELVATTGEVSLRHRRIGDVQLHPLASDQLAGRLGILRFFRDDEEHIQGFTLNDELLPDRGLRFRRLGE
ncbi:MAG: beta-lactamase family protein [Gemmatimonadota bacterium]|nr:MAG: beta-lactamase family protein [Gemmatimonadota bacterium]